MSTALTASSPRPSLPYTNEDLSSPEGLLHALLHLRQTVIREGDEIYRLWQSRIRRASFLASSRNLAHYLVLRRHDLRTLQTALMPWGLSSLGRIESRVLNQLDAAIATLGKLCHITAEPLPQRPELSAFFEGERLLQHHADELFGSLYGTRRVRMMVTLPSEAASNVEFVRDLLARGMDCARINCAHDTVADWEAMIGNIRKAEVDTGRRCKILMDLGGPKPRLKMASALTPVRVKVGDRLLLTRNVPEPGMYVAARCSIPEILDRVRVDERIWIDDGSIGTRVEAIAPEGVLLQVTHASTKGSKVRSDKGLNFPDSNLDLTPLTPKDLQDLDFVVGHADIIGYSFVQTAADIELLQREIGARLRGDSELPAIVAKIETPKAIKNLPELIVQAAGVQPLGIMIARGDLAVEIGYERLAEIQEEILWLCEASHIPVIWATQVLERLVKKGIPSRAEITDAAMAERAECVMLNKGRYIANAVTILDDVLTRMQTHQLKKTPQLRALRSW
ncbi:MAG: pyruvate kinase [Cyanobacteria bacterium J06639_1]